VYFIFVVESKSVIEIKRSILMGSVDNEMPIVRGKYNMLYVRNKLNSFLFGILIGNVLAIDSGDYEREKEI
jgi:hypothetical protein